MTNDETPKYPREPREAGSEEHGGLSSELRTLN